MRKKNRPKPILQQVQIDIPASHPDTCHDLLLTQTFHMDEQNTYNPHIMLDKPPSSPDFRMHRNTQHFIVVSFKMSIYSVF